jgi:hypothetical protein
MTTKPEELYSAVKLLFQIGENDVADGSEEVTESAETGGGLRESNMEGRRWPALAQ